MNKWVLVCVCAHACVLACVCVSISKCSSITACDGESIVSLDYLHHIYIKFTVAFTLHLNYFHNYIYTAFPLQSESHLNWFHCCPFNEKWSVLGLSVFPQSHVVRSCTPTLLFSVKAVDVLSRPVKTHQIINHFGKASAFTTKVNIWQRYSDFVW